MKRGLSRIKRGLVMGLVGTAIALSGASGATAQDFTIPPPSHLKPLLKNGHKDSIPDEAKWKQVVPGMEKRRVTALLGDPPETWGLRSGMGTVEALSYYYRNNEERHVWISTTGFVFTVFVQAPEKKSAPQKKK